MKSSPLKSVWRGYEQKLNRELIASYAGLGWGPSGSSQPFKLIVNIPSKSCARSDESCDRMESYSGTSETAGQLALARLVIAQEEESRVSDGRDIEGIMKILRSSVRLRMGMAHLGLVNIQGG